MNKTLASRNMFVKAKVRVESGVGMFIDVFAVDGLRLIETVDYIGQKKITDYSGVKVQFASREDLKYLFSDDGCHYYEKS